MEQLFNYVVGCRYPNGEIVVAGYALGADDVIQFGSTTDAEQLLSYVCTNQEKIEDQPWEIIKLA